MRVLLLPRLGLLLGGGPVELLALGVGQDVAVELEELQVHPGTVQSAPQVESRIWSPIATPPRDEPPAGLNTPNGRFWIGNSAWP